MDMTKRDVMYHIGLGTGDAGGYCILPGDPGRGEGSEDARKDPRADVCSLKKAEPLTAAAGRAGGLGDHLSARPPWQPGGPGTLNCGPVCWQEALRAPAGGQHDNETVSMEMSL